MLRQDDQAWGRVALPRALATGYLLARNVGRHARRKSRRLDTWEWVIAVLVFVASAVVTFLFVLSIG